MNKNKIDNKDLIEYKNKYLKNVKPIVFRQYQNHNVFLNLFKKLGFEVILEIPYSKKENKEFILEKDMNMFLLENGYKLIKTTEVNQFVFNCEYLIEHIEYFLFNKHMTSFIHMNSKPNTSIIFYANGELRDKTLNIKETKIEMTDFYDITLDLSILPLEKFTNFIETFKPLKNFASFSALLHDELSHKDNEKDWFEIGENKLKMFPIEILERLIKDNVILSNISENLHEEIFYDSVSFKFRKLAKAIPLHLKKEFVISAIIFNTLASNEWIESFTPNIIKYFESFNLKFEDFKEMGYFLYLGVSDFKISNLKEIDFINYINYQSIEKLKKIVESKKEEKYNDSFYPDGKGNKYKEIIDLAILKLKE